MKYWVWIILTALLAVVWVVSAQPTRTNTRIPTDVNGNPVGVEYGWNGGAYKQLGMSGAVFDQLVVQQDNSVTAAWESFAVSPGRAGFVIFNNGSSAIACSTAEMSRAIHIGAASSAYVPLQTTTVFYKTEAAPAVEVQYGSVN